LISCSGSNNEPSQNHSPPPQSQTPPSSPAGFDTESLKGIDANGNGVRDEVETALLTSAGNNQSLYAAMLAQAKAYQTWYDRQTVTASEAQALIIESFRLGRCIQSAAESAGTGLNFDKEVMLRTFSTPARMRARNVIYSKAGAFELPQQTPGC
jgi:hypothetical protein